MKSPGMGKALGWVPNRTAGRLGALRLYGKPQSFSASVTIEITRDFQSKRCRCAGLRGAPTAHSRAVRAGFRLGVEAIGHPAARAHAMAPADLRPLPTAPGGAAEAKPAKTNTCCGPREF